MLFEEKDAHKFWCPMVRHSDENTSSFNRATYGPEYDIGGSGIANDANDVGDDMVTTTWNRCVGNRCVMFKLLSHGGDEGPDYYGCGLAYPFGFTG